MLITIVKHLQPTLVYSTNAWYSCVGFCWSSKCARFNRIKFQILNLYDSTLVTTVTDTFIVYLVCTMWVVCVDVSSCALIHWVSNNQLFPPHTPVIWAESDIWHTKHTFHLSSVFIHSVYLSHVCNHALMSCTIQISGQKTLSSQYCFRACIATSNTGLIPRKCMNWPN